MMDQSEMSDAQQETLKGVLSKMEAMLEDFAREAAQLLKQIESWRGILASAAASARAQIGGADPDDVVARIAGGDN